MKKQPPGPGPADTVAYGACRAARLLLLEVEARPTKTIGPESYPEDFFIYISKTFEFFIPMYVCFSSIVDFVATIIKKRTNRTAKTVKLN